MGALRIHLFGALHLSRDPYIKEIKIKRGVMGLLAYLVIYRERLHSRDALTGLFWGDSSESRARSCLSSALWRLRRILEPAGIPAGSFLLNTPSGDVGFNRESRYWLDVEELETHAAQILSRPCHALSPGEVDETEKCLKLYSGDLLEGYYEEWAVTERERLRSLYLKSLAHLLGYYSHKGAYDNALSCGHRILNLDPLREEIHREMMRLYTKSGRRPQALRQYDICRKILMAELEVPPMEETRALRTEIIARTLLEQAQSDPQGNVHNVRHALRQLQEALGRFDQAMGHLRTAAEHLEEVLPQ